MKNKKLGNITVEPVEDPKNPGQLYVDSFGWTPHVGVNFTGEHGRFQKGWIPLELWNQLPEVK